MAEQNTRRVVQPYWIINLTNLHAGSGDTTYGIIDREIQRDNPSDVPVIHGSGLKGAYRELFEEVILGRDSDIVTTIFGYDERGAKGAENKRDLTPGGYDFHDARLITLPVRSSNYPFFMATSPELISEFLYNTELMMYGDVPEDLKTLYALSELQPEKGKPFGFGVNKASIPVNTQIEDLAVQDYWTLTNDINEDSKEKIIEAVNILQPAVNGNSGALKVPLAVMHNDDMKVRLKELPVIARNNLENGISKNLWYEEVLPRYSRLYSYTICDQSLTENDNDFFKQLENNRNLVQVGGNATIGYGLCNVERINKK